MHGVLVLRTRAAWRHKWLSLLAIALLVAVALAVTVTAAAGARRSRSAPARFLREDVTPDVLVSMQPLGSLAGVEEMSKLPQVQSVSVNVGVAVFPPNAYAPMFAPVDGTGGITATRGLLLEGRRPDPRAADEVMLSEGHARTLRAHVGDRLPMTALTQAQTKRCLYADELPPDCTKLMLEDPRLSLKVVGITRTASDVNSRAADITVSVLSGGFFAAHRGDIGWNPVVAVRLRPGASPEEFVTAARHALPEGTEGQFDLINANATFDAVDVLSTGLALFALVAGLAGAFAVGQAVARHVRAEDEEREVLATLGATRRELFSDALAPVLVAAAVGVAVGLVAAFVASQWMPIGFARRIEPNRGRELDWVVAGAGVVLTSVLVAGIAIAAVVSSRRRVVVRRASKIPAFLAGIVMTPTAGVGLRHACSPGRGRRAVPVRSAVIGVAAATAGIIGVLGFSAGLAHLVDTPALYGWTFDVAGIDTAYTAKVTADPAVGALADVRFGVPLQVDDRPTFGQVFAPLVGDATPAVVAGRAPISQDEIALGADTMDAAHTRIGRTVAVEGADGKLAMRVVGQSVFPTGSDAYPMADGAVITPAALAELGEGDSAHFLAVRYRPGADRAAAFARFDALDDEVDPASDPPDRPTPPGEVEKLRQVESLPKVLAMFLALLGVVALAHALVVGARRRARDFAVLRALGFRRRQVRSAISWEAGALAFAGAAIGIPAGIILARLAWARTARGVGVLVVQRMTPAVILVIVPAAVILAIAIALIPARRAAKMRPAEILRSE